MAQGSLSGPLLFLVFMNDSPYHIQYSTLDLFANDTRLRKIISSPLDCILLHYDIKNLFEWSIRNVLNFNIKKSQIICTFSYLSKISRRIQIFCQIFIWSRDLSINQQIGNNPKLKNIENSRKLVLLSYNKTYPREIFIC